MYLIMKKDGIIKIINRYNKKLGERVYLGKEL